MPFVQVAVMAMRDKDGLLGPPIPLYREMSEEEAAKCTGNFCDEAAKVLTERYIAFRARRMAELEAEKRREAEKAERRKSRGKQNGTQ